jgi:dephospho-CoA kinase
VAAGGGGRDPLAGRERGGVTPAAGVETPLLFEAGLDRGYDVTIAVIADEHLRSARADARGHAAVAQRTARQLSQMQKSQRATYTVVNDGTEAELSSKLSVVLDRLAG